MYKRGENNQKESKRRGGVKKKKKKKRPIKYNYYFRSQRKVCPISQTSYNTLDRKGDRFLHFNQVFCLFVLTEGKHFKNALI
jgi:hypothetical protein